MQTEAQLFKALADETRLKILWLLMQQKKLCVTDIAGTLLIPQSRVSRHMRYLFNARFGHGQEGRYLCILPDLSNSRKPGG
jgi:DNA-binding transcriptional ArsR family regulator